MATVIIDPNALANVPEEHPASEGEHEVSIISGSVEQGEYPRIALAFRTVDEPDTTPIYHALFLPRASDEETKKNGALRRIKTFCEVFGVDTSTGELNPEEWRGLTGRAVVRHREDAEYGLQARITRFI